MKEYRIAVDYTVCGEIKVKAKNFKEAIKKAWKDYGTTDVEEKEYIDESWNVNEEQSEYEKEKND